MSSVPSAVDDLQFTSHSASDGITTNAGSLPGPSNPASSDDFSNPLSSQLSKSSHPSQIILHIAFKVASLFLYLVNPSSSFVTSFVIIILLLSADFYAVKNLTGRKLAKLRWWNSVDAEGNNQWTYECLDETDAKLSINKADVSFFWTVLYVYPVAWAVFLVLALIRFKFEWVLLDAVGLGLALANLVGYTRCDKIPLWSHSK